MPMQNRTDREDRYHTATGMMLMGIIVAIAIVTQTLVGWPSTDVIVKAILKGVQ